MDQILIKDKKYCGQYVLIKDLKDPTVIASGDDPQKVYQEAEKKGCSDPLLLFVPAKDMAQIYYQWIS